MKWIDFQVKIHLLNFLDKLQSNKIYLHAIMGKKSVLSNIWNWLISSEMFARPSKLLPGKWQLFEYFVEPGNELVNVKEEQIKAENQCWEIEFDEENFVHKSNLSIEQISLIEGGNWSISKNYITLIHPKDFRNNIEFQFAIEKGNLKLLKKDTFGKIIFFGFFRRIEINK